MVKSLILVEGKDDIKFINLLLGYLKINKKDIVIKQLNNKSNFFKLDFYTDYYIMCDPNSKDGNLEHLIISTLSTEKQQCVNELLECIRPHKNSGNKKIVLSSYKTIFDEPDYNFSHLNYQNLISKLILLMNGEE